MIRYTYWGRYLLLRYSSKPDDYSRLGSAAPCRTAFSSEYIYKHTQKGLPQWAAPSLCFDSVRGSKLVVEHIAQCLLVDLAVQLCKMLRELDALRADALAVLAVAAARDAALLHQRIEALRRIELSERMEVKEERLRRRCRSDEVRLRSDVRARLKAAPAGHAVRQLVAGLRCVRILDRRILVVPRTVDLDPAMDALEALEHNRAVDEEIADDGERTRRLYADRLREIVDQRAARLLCVTIDDHHACTADLLKAVALPDRGRNALAVDRHRVLLDLHEGRNDVETGTIVNLELLRIGVLVRSILTLDDKTNFFLFCHDFYPPLLLLGDGVVTRTRLDE